MASIPENYVDQALNALGYATYKAFDVAGVSLFCGTVGLIAGRIIGYSSHVGLINGFVSGVVFQYVTVPIDAYADRSQGLTPEGKSFLRGAFLVIQFAVPFLATLYLSGPLGGYLAHSVFLKGLVTPALYRMPGVFASVVMTTAALWVPMVSIGKGG